VRAGRDFPNGCNNASSGSVKSLEREIVTDVGGVENSGCGAVIPIGVNSERGLIAAACHRTAQKALRDQEQELRKAHDELEIKVAERTSELRGSERELRDVIDTITTIAWSAVPDGSHSYVMITSDLWSTRGYRRNRQPDQDGKQQLTPMIFSNT
jgi:PAS domain-containing protein